MNQFGKFAEKIGILVQGGTVNVGQIRLDSEMSRQELRNRKALLNNVRTAWVEGVLEKSLHEQIPIVLGLETRPSAVASPWNMDIINPDKSCQPLPAGTPVIDVFDKLGEGGTLLILGEPGSGKTITLLQLARDLIARAEDEIDRRIPVVLNLSSWAAETQTIAKWIVEELNSKYQVNRKIGQQWVEKQELLLLLDGLDEIRDLEKRNACVTALNAFQREQGTEMVVCCRVSGYEELGDHRLKLRSALALQLLTPNQIQAYLDRLQSNVTALKIVLQGLTLSPLYLNIMVLTYNGIEIADIPKIISDPFKPVWDDYIERMFQGSRLFAHLTIYKSPENQTYSRKDTTHWLVWMAKQMIQRSQSIFLIEKIDYKMYFNWESIRDSLLESGWLLILEISLLVLSIISVTIGWLINGLIGGLSVFFVLSLIFVGIQRLLFDCIEPVESVIFSAKWNRKKFKNKFYKLFKVAPNFGLIFGFIFGLGLSLIDSLYLGLFGSLYGIFFALYSAFSDSLNVGLIRLEVEETMFPNQGIKKSAINSLIVGTIGGLTIGICFGLLGMYWGLTFGIIGGLFGLIAGLGQGITFGGKACIQHFVLRLILYFAGYIPWNYAKFLDWGSDQLLLQKVGGGYIFIHRSLMEHFAEMENG